MESDAFIFDRATTGPLPPVMKRKIAQKDGKIVAKIQLDKDKDPQIHGLELKAGVLWYCDASKGWICNLT